jgi:hypothetical protein
MKAMNGGDQYAPIAMEESATKIKHLEDQLKESNCKVQRDICI